MMDFLISRVLMGDWVRFWKSRFIVWGIVFLCLVSLWTVQMFIAFLKKL